MLYYWGDPEQVPLLLRQKAVCICVWHYVVYKFVDKCIGHIMQQYYVDKCRHPHVILLIKTSTSVEKSCQNGPPGMLQAKQSYAGGSIRIQKAVEYLTTSEMKSVAT